MLLTMADTSCGGLLAGHTGMSLYGPPGLNTLVNAFRTFVNVRDIGLKVNEFSCATRAAEPVVSSELVTITPVTITAAAWGGPKAAGSDDVCKQGGSVVEPEPKRQRVEPSNGELRSMDIASVAVASPAACYICELPDVPGKFLPQKVM